MNHTQQERSLGMMVMMKAKTDEVGLWRGLDGDDETWLNVTTGRRAS
jgi:hypothetical protein